MTPANVSDFLRRLAQGMAAETLAHESDRQLVGRFLDERDQAAFEALVRRHGPMVYRVSWRTLQHTEDAEEAFQATFLLLASKLGTVRKQHSLASWLHGVARRVALQARAQAAARRRRERRVAAPEGILHDDHVSWEEVRTVLDAELAGLPEKWRLPLILCYLESRTQGEAAAQLGWSKNTLGRRLQEAREALGRRLARRGLALSAAFYGLLLSDSSASAVVAPKLIASTVEAGCGVALGGEAVPLVSARVIALTEGAVKTVFLRNAILLAFVGTALGLGTAGAVLGVPGEPQPARPQTAPPQAAGSDAKPARPAGERSSSQTLT